MSTETVIDLAGYTRQLEPEGFGLLRDITARNRTYPSRDHWGQWMAFHNGNDWLVVFSRVSDPSPSEWQVVNDGGWKLKVTTYDGSVPRYRGYAGVAEEDWQTALAEQREWARAQSWTQKRKEALHAEFSYQIMGSHSVPNALYDHLYPILGCVEKGSVRLTNYRAEADDSSQAVLFDADYPNYAVRDGYRENIAYLYEHGHSVWPYLNGLAWHSEHAEYNDNLALFMRDESDNVISWGSANGAGTLDFVCPSQYKVFADRLRAEFNAIMDGQDYVLKSIYLDLAGATIPRICHSDQHDHAVGDAKQWITNTQKLFAEFADLDIQTEMVGETFINYVDAVVTYPSACGTNDSETVPAYSWFYSDRVRFVGCDVGGHSASGSPVDKATQASRAETYRDAFELYCSTPLGSYNNDMDVNEMTRDELAQLIGPDYKPRVWYATDSASGYGTGVSFDDAFDGLGNAIWDSAGSGTSRQSGLKAGDSLLVYGQHAASVTVDLPVNMNFAGGAEVTLVTYVEAADVSVFGGKFSQQMYVTSADRFVIYDAAFGSIEPAGQLDMVDADDARLAGCFFNTSSGNNNTYAIDFEGPTDGGIIQTNVFTDGHVGIRVRSDFAGGSTTEQHANLKIRFNLFQDFTRGTASNADAVQFSGGASDDPAAGHTNVEVSDNRIRNCADNGIDLFGASGVSVLRNEVSDIAAGGDNVGVKLGQGTRANTDNYLIGNVVYDCGWIGVVGAPISGGVHQNTVAYCGSYGLSLATTGMPIGGASALYIYNNIVAYCDSGDADDACNNYNHTLVGRMGGNCYYQEDPSALVVRGSLGSYSTNNFATFRDVFEPTSIAANPQFVDAANRNFNLEPSSPCVRAGVKWWSSGEAQPHGQNGLRFPLSASGQPDMGAYPVRSDAGYARRAQALKVGVLDGGVDIVKARRI